MISLNDEIGKSFGKHAVEYDYVARVQLEIGQRLFERLNYLKISPRRILDLGCGTGTFSRELARAYPKAQIIGLDLAYPMLMQSVKKQSWLRKWPLIQADMAQLPFANGFFDLVFANQVIHWASSQSLVFRELNRVMNVNACLMFTTLGPDTFKELKGAWSESNAYAHVNEFRDMHDLGDDLLKEHFLDPVMDMELLSVHYESAIKLVKALHAQGVKNVNSERNKGLTGKTAWQRFEKNYANFVTQAGKYPLTYEVVYGHAWKGEQRNLERGTETLIPVSKIRVR